MTYHCTIIMGGHKPSIHTLDVYDIYDIALQTLEEFLIMNLQLTIINHSNHD